MSDTEEEFHISYLDDNLKSDDDDFDMWLRAMGKYALDKHPDTAEMKLRIAAAFIRVGLKVAHDVGPEEYYEFTARVMKTVGRDMDALHEWAEKHLVD